MTYLRARLQREYIEATKALAGIAKQMERHSGARDG